MMDVPTRAPLVLAVGVLIGTLTLPACIRSGSSDPAESARSSDSVTTETSVSLPRSATAEEAPPAPPSSNDTRSVKQQVADASMTARLKRALVRERSLRLFDFQPEVVDGHATIRGDVNTREQHRRAERVARTVDGIEAVTNKITVNGRPVSEADSSSATRAETTPRSEDSAPSVYYTVRKGDTLWEIAREHETSIRQLRSLNDLHSSSLHPGKRIRIR